VPAAAATSTDDPGPTRARRGWSGAVAAAVRRHPVGAHLGLTFLLSWGYWIPLAITGGEGSHVPGLLGPAIAAVVITAILDGRRGLHRLVARVGRWRVPARWYLAAFAPLLTGAVGLGILRLVTSEPITWRSLSSFPGLAEVGWLGVFVLTLVINGLGEEVGWRGFVWPRLRRHRSLGGAALVLAVPWAIWHVPTFWLATGMDLEPYVVPGWLLGLAAGAVVLGWLYERTGSLLLVALFHASLNMVSGTDVPVLPAALTSMAIIVVAVALLRRSARRDAHAFPAVDEA
jgi:uncharacterized protein